MDTFPKPFTPEFSEILELAEAEWNESKLKALSVKTNNAKGVVFKQFGQVRAMLATGLANNPSYNRAFHITAEDFGKIADIKNWFANHKVRYAMDIAPPLSNKKILEGLALSYLSPMHFSNIVFAELETIDTRRKYEHRIEIVETDQQFHQFSIALSSAFGIPTELIENTAVFSRSLYSSPSWKVLLIKINDSPAAITTLHLSKLTASITCMGTSIGFRNIGLQKSMIEKCIAVAREAKCSIITSQVTPGSISELNTIKTGFKIAYTKCMYSTLDGAY